MKNLLIFLIICVLIAFCGFFLTGCDEGMNMADDVIMETGETTDPTMNGEVKQPDLTTNDEIKKPDDTETPDPVADDEVKQPEPEVLVDPSEPNPMQIETITSWNPEDFTGIVCTPKSKPKHQVIRTDTRPVPGTQVTITSGPRTGEVTFTDNNGRYLFLDVDGDKLQLQVEREQYEPKEVIVYRSRSTSVLSSTPNVIVVDRYKEESPEYKPGNILIGRRWPDEIRFILKETLLPHDLLYVDSEGTYYTMGAEGGMVVVSSASSTRRGYILTAFAHELAHAHQSAVGMFVWKPWVDTPEGKAYIEARNKDLKEVGELNVDSEPGYGGDNLFENAADICSYYWNRWDGKSRYENKKRAAPNRFKWAEEWLSRKYN